MSGEEAHNLRIAFRAREGCGMLDFDLKTQKTLKPDFKSGGIDYMSHDTIGNNIATWGRKSGKVEVFTCHGDLLMSVDVDKVMGLKLSHKGTYLAIWKAPEMESRKENLLLYKISTKELLTTLWNPTWPCVEWDQADINTVIFSLHTGVKVYEDLTKEPVQELAGKWSQVHMSYTSPSVIAAMYIPPENDRDKTPSIIKMVRIPKLEKVLLEHKLRMDDANIIWNRKGTAALLNASLDLDESGKSYYGETTLMVFNIQDKKITQIDTGRTPVHDVKWAESGKEFCVVYGTMPSNKASIYSEKGELLYNFDIAPRNTIHWSPHSRLFSLCGFGNLPGNVINYDRSTLDKKSSANASVVGKFQMSSVTKFAWSPCSRYVMCCTTHPRMTTANKLCIYKHNGEKMYEEAHTELYDAVWLPHSSKAFPQRDPSPMRGSVQEAEKPKAATFRAAGRDPGLANAIKNQLSANKRAGYSAPGASTRTSESFTSWRTGGKVEEAPAEEEKPPSDGKRRAPDILVNQPKPKKEKAPKAPKQDISEIVDQLPLEDFTTKSYPDVVKAMKAAKKKVQECSALRDKTLNDMQRKKLANYSNFKAEAAYLEKLSKSGKTSQ
eukprot:TRINITY_DN4698_c0_g1_i1.p1 TRINITY_DN4698_c0_g1~~TRINITY_DN4698_c0_g1_i1.p1  ORF type:complete len:622 (+),score=169.14 TRINITY_DN4698_c0_g1_i1:45-1868(+)